MVFDYLIRQGKEAPLLRQGGARGGWITWFDRAKRIRLPEAFIEPPRLPALLPRLRGDRLLAKEGISFLYLLPDYKGKDHQPACSISNLPELELPPLRRPRTLRFTQ